MGHHKCAYPKLKGKIIEVCQTQTALAVQLNMSRATFSKKMTGCSEWTLTEMCKICDILHIDRADVCDYFFV